MTSTCQDSTASRQRKGRQNPQSPYHDMNAITKRTVKKGAVPRCTPTLSEIKKKGKMKKLSQPVEEDLVMGLQGLDLNPEVKVMSGTGLVFDEQLNDFRCLWDDSYPENPERLHAIKEQLIQEGLLDRCVCFPARVAEKEELMLVHSPEYIDLMETTQYMNEGELRILASTYDSVYLHPNSFICACLASGSVLRLVDAVLGADIRNGMAIIRPPGHHAQRDVMNGYCMFNHVAVAARYAQKKHHLKRILIVDWDVHHGQGTQFTFDQDPSVLYFSIHRYEQGRFWPHLQASNWSAIGCGQGQGYNINIPWNQVGMRDADYIAAFLHILLPVASEFQPQLVLVAAGYDALQGDPKGEMAATPAGFAQLTHMLMGMAGGKLILSLEGGYNLQSLARGVSASLHTLLGDPCPMLEFPVAPCQSALASVSYTLDALEPFWEVLVNMVDSTEEDNEGGSNWEERQEEGEGPLVATSLPVLTWPTVQHRTGLVYDQRMMSHCNLWDSHHPETPQRILRIMCHLEELGLAARLLHLPVRAATDAELLTCHSAEYVERLRATETMKTRDLHREGANFDSIYICPSTFTCAQLATGSVCSLVEAVLSGEVLNGIALVRPPGHHAEHNAACGFCFFNSVAVAARHAQAIRGNAFRILIVDWDIHHGNGTQHIFENDPSVLYMSLHRYDRGNFFPVGDEGSSSHVGLAEGMGFTVNVAWNGPRMGDADYLAAWHRLVLPVAYEFNPELVLVSAGFDAAQGDPLGGCQVSPECYAHLTHLLMGLANGHTILILEGGYNLTSISESMAACTHSLLGDPPPLLSMLRPPQPGALASIMETIQVHRKYWRSLRAPKVEDKDSPCTSKPITKKASHPTHLRLVKGVTMSEGKGVKASTRKINSAPAPKTPTTTHTKVKNTKAATSQNKAQRCTWKTKVSWDTSENTVGGAMVVQATFQNSVGGTKVDQATSTETMGEAMMDPVTFEESVGEGVVVDKVIYEKTEGIKVDQATSEETVGGNTVNEATSEETVGGDMVDHATSEETVGGGGKVNQATSKEMVGGDIVDQATSDTMGRAKVDQATSDTMGRAKVDQATSKETMGGDVVDEVTSKETVGGDTVDRANSNKTMGGAKVDEVTSKETVGGAKVDEVTSKETVGGAKVDEVTSKETMGGAKVDEVTSKETVGGAKVDEVTTKETVGGAKVDEVTIKETMGGATSEATREVIIDQTNSEDAVGGAKRIQTPLDSDRDKQISLRQGTTSQLSPNQQSPRILEPDNEAQRALEDEDLEDEGLLGEAAGGEPINNSELVYGSGEAAAAVAAIGVAAESDEDLFYAVTPMPWCPHLGAVCPIPAAGLDVSQPCNTCGTFEENWVCLSCYKVYCSRYINGHMVNHYEASQHPLVLSCVDLSSWCYHCQAYVHHQDVLHVKIVAHQNKFGEDMPFSN
ncbi:protein deacetylase HDAC6 isoform 2-T3 [Thomomys bottae]